MSAWIQAGVLALALIAGFAAGWIAGKRTGLRMPSLWVSAVFLILGSLGGPLLTFKLLGRGDLSYIVALLIAGAATGVVFWPMSLKQGEKQWL